jgi:hypothetical protein
LRSEKLFMLRDNTWIEIEPAKDFLTNTEPGAKDSILKSVYVKARVAWFVKKDSVTLENLEEPLGHQRIEVSLRNVTDGLEQSSVLQASPTSLILSLPNKLLVFRKDNSFLKAKQIDLPRSAAAMKLVAAGLIKDSEGVWSLTPDGLFTLQPDSNGLWSYVGEKITLNGLTPFSGAGELPKDTRNGISDFWILTKKGIHTSVSSSKKP